MTLTINDENLLRYNQEGIIPGPNESEKDFLMRADYCTHIEEHLHQQTHFDFSEAKKVSASSDLDEVHRSTRSLFDISPTWIPILYDNHKLSFWHGGCAWIFQMTENSPVSAILQLRKSLFARDSLLGLFAKKEILAHEMSHIGRMAFEEPNFEEIFAYRTSPSPFRRWIGPIAKNSIESGIFVLVLLLIVMLDCFFVFFASSSAYYHAMWFKLIPIIMVGFGVLRLYLRHRQLDRCEKILFSLCHSEVKASAIAYRLTDEEIIRFSKATKEEIQTYIDEQRPDSLRWRLISLAYLS